MNTHKRRALLFGILLLVVAVLISACSARSQARWNGTINMGSLPNGIAFNEDGSPQIITISTESDGDIVFTYVSTEGETIAQLYGCPIVSVACSQLEKQGRYVWTNATATPAPTLAPLQAPFLGIEDRMYHLGPDDELDAVALQTILEGFEVDLPQEYEEESRTEMIQYVANNYQYHMSVGYEMYIVITRDNVGPTFDEIYVTGPYRLFSNYSGWLYIQIDD